MRHVAIKGFATGVTCAAVILILGGCASQATLDAIDVKFDRILAENCGGIRSNCWHQESVRKQEKETANQPISNFFRKWIFEGGGGGGNSRTTYVIILN